MNGSGLDIIARIETPFAEKFGVPRQSGIADSPGRIVFEKPFRDVDAVRGLEGFSHIWLIWQFDRAQRQGWSPTVRPPRLGGNERVGVFATRSPFRPNGLGLSAVELERVALDEPEGPVLYGPRRGYGQRNAHCGHQALSGLRGQLSRRRRRLYRRRCPARC